jgi:glycosyltransferase involved in cell wall biosynthesis
MHLPTSTPDPALGFPVASEGRIAIFMFDFARTGVVANAVRMANVLATHGRQVCFLVCHDHGRDFHRIHPAVTVHVAPPVPLLRKVSRSLALVSAVPALRRQLRQLQPEILLSAGNHGHVAATLAARELPQMRLVLRISNELTHSHNDPLTRRWRRGLHQKLVNQADRLLLVSAHLAKDPLLAQAVADGKAVVTPNGVDIERVRRLGTAECPHPWLQQSTPVVLGVGRLSPHKNFATLVRAVAHAARERPLRLIIVGGGPAAERQRLESLAQELGIGELLHLQGEVGNPFPFMARAGTFVLPSLWEGSSNVLLEALACEVPIVAARSAGNAQEVLGYGRFGLLVDPDDVEAMAQAILYQLSADARHPGKRASDFAAAEALARACAALTDVVNVRASTSAP